MVNLKTVWSAAAAWNGAAFAAVRFDGKVRNALIGSRSFLLKEHMFTISVAGLKIGIEHHFKAVLRECEPYLTADEPDFCVAAADEKILAERRNFGKRIANAESICLQREIAERLPAYDAFVFHAAILAIDGCAYAFTAPSGTGKTTHIRQYLQCYGERVKVLNGDKPILRKTDGRFFAYGTPWNGKEKLGEKLAAPLCGICFLERGETNEIAALSKEDAPPRMMRQIYLPHDAQNRLRMLQLLDELLLQTPLYLMHCEPTPEAARMSYAAMHRKPV